MTRDAECSLGRRRTNISAVAQTVEIARKLKEDLNQLKI